MYYETSFPVRYYETDQMGIVHHSNYIRYFECARNAMMADGGYPIEQCEKDGVTIPIVEVRARYRRPAVMGDILTVSAAIESLPLAKLVVRQEVRNSTGELCVDGEVILGFLSKETGRPVRCPDKLLSLIQNRLSDK